MKKFIFLLVLAFVAIATSAQNKVTSSKTFRVLPAAADTLNKDDVTHYYMYVSNYAVKFKVQADIDSVAGYPLVQVILRKSMDYQTWTNLDTLTVSEATESAISTVIEPYTPYLDIQATATDSVQTSKLTYTILIEKNP